MSKQYNISYLERLIEKGAQQVEHINQLLDEQREANTLSTAILDIMPVPLIVVDPNGSIIRTNIESERLFGYGQKEMLGQQLEMLMPQEVRSAHRAYHALFNAQPRIREMGSGVPIVGQRKTGERIDLDIKLAPVPTSKGICTAALIQEVSPRP